MATLQQMRPIGYIFVTWFLLISSSSFFFFLSSFFPRLISAVADWMYTITSIHDASLPSNRHHRSNGDCLEGKRENYQLYSVQYCASQLCTVQCTHIWTDLTVLWIGLCPTELISLCLDSFLWSPYVIGQTIIFLPCDFYLSSFFVITFLA